MFTPDNPHNAEALQGRANPSPKSAQPSGSLTQISSQLKIGKGNWLKNGNPAGDPNNAPRCGAKTRKATPCQSPAMPNGKCRMHGGASTGPRTAAGLARSRCARWKHGRYSVSATLQRRQDRWLITMIRYFTGRIRDKRTAASITAWLERSLSSKRPSNRTEKEKGGGGRPLAIAPAPRAFTDPLERGSDCMGSIPISAANSANTSTQEISGLSGRSSPKLP